jgi:hypothetical protein
MQDNNQSAQLAKPNSNRMNNPEFDDGSRNDKVEPSSYQFMSLQVTSAGQDDVPGKNFKRPISSQN